MKLKEIKDIADDIIRPRIVRLSLLLNSDSNDVNITDKRKIYQGQENFLLDFFQEANNCILKIIDGLKGVDEEKEREILEILVDLTWDIETLSSRFESSTKRVIEWIRNTVYKNYNDISKKTLRSGQDVRRKLFDNSGSTLRKNEKELNGYLVDHAKLSFRLKELQKIIEQTLNVQTVIPNTTDVKNAALATAADRDALKKMYSELLVQDVTDDGGMVLNDENNEDDVISSQVQALMDFVTADDFTEESSPDPLAIDITEVQLQKKLAVGTTGLLYQGQWNYNDVAVKIFAPMDGVGQHVFREEVNKLMSIRSSHVARVFGYACYPSIQFLVMEYFPRGSLYKYIDKANLSLNQKIIIAKDILYGLANIHRQGIIHGNLNSLNILIDESGRAKIADFGFRQTRTMSLRKTTMTREKKPLENLAWDAPEKFGNRPLTVAADIYSVAVILLELFSGQHPFAMVKEDAVRIEKDKNGKEVSVNTLAWHIKNGKIQDEINMLSTSGLRRILRGCCDLEPEKRWALTDLIGSFTKTDDLFLNECVLRLVKNPTTLSTIDKEVNATPKRPAGQEDSLIELYYVGDLLKARVRGIRFGARDQQGKLTTIVGKTEWLEIKNLEGAEDFNPENWPWRDSDDIEISKEDRKLHSDINQFLMQIMHHCKHAWIRSNPNHLVQEGRELLAKSDPKSQKQAFDLFLEAAALGDINAKFALVGLYARGIGAEVKADKLEAQKIYLELKNNPEVFQRQNGLEQLKELQRKLYPLPPPPRVSSVQPIPQSVSSVPQQRVYTKRVLRPVEPSIKMIFVDFDDTLVHMTNKAYLKLETAPVYSNEGGIVKREAALKVPELTEPCLVYAAIKKIPVFILTSRSKAMDSGKDNGGITVAAYCEYLHEKYNFQIITDVIIDNDFSEELNNKFFDIQNYKQQTHAPTEYYDDEFKLGPDEYLKLVCSGKNYAMLKKMRTYKSSELLDPTKEADRNKVLILDDASGNIRSAKSYGIIGIDVIGPTQVVAPGEHVPLHNFAFAREFAKLIGLEDLATNPQRLDDETDVRLKKTAENYRDALQIYQKGTGIAPKFVSVERNRFSKDQSPNISQRRQPNRGKLPTVPNKYAPDYNYESKDVNTLLKHYFGDNADVLISSAVGPEGIYAINSRIPESGQVKVFILPLCINRHHWVLSYFLYDGARKQPRVFYFDPLGGAIDATFKGVLLKFLKETDIVNLWDQVQYDLHNTGPWIIEAARSLANTGKLPDFEDINPARKQHREIFYGQKQFKLPEFLIANNLSLHKTAPDGNCFFSSVALHLNYFGKSLSHMDVRRDALKYIEQHPAMFQHVFGQDFDEGTQAQYLARMAKDQEWATGTVIQAAALCYGVRFTIYDVRDNAELPTPINHEAGEDKPLFLLYRTGEDVRCQHYEALLPLQSRLEKSSTTDLKQIQTFQGIINEPQDLIKQFPQHRSESLCFIFPGNNRHAYNSLEECQGGSGLAGAAKKLNKAKIPVMSLPTVRYNALEQQKSVTTDMAKQALMMLWYVVGLGLQPILPVRNRHEVGKIIGDDELRELVNAGAITNLVEPGFLGGKKMALFTEEKSFIKGLGKAEDTSLLKYYFDNIAYVYSFIHKWNKSSINSRNDLIETFTDVQFKQTFNYGRQNQDNATRLTISQKSLVTKTASPNAESEPGFFSKMFKGILNPVDDQKMLPKGREPDAGASPKQ